MALTNILYPEGNLQKIKQTATGPFDYNVQAQADLTKNVSNAISNPLIQTAFDFAAPATAGILSIPYDAMQAATRINETDVANAFNTAGMMGPRDITSEMFGTSYSRENPLTSLLGRFVGASAPLSERLSNWKDDGWTIYPDSPITGQNIQRPNITKLIQMSRRRQQLQDFKNIEAKTAAEAAAKAKADAAAKANAAAASQRREGKGGTHMSRSRDQGGLGISQSQAQSISDANRAAGMSGWGLADGGLAQRAPRYANGGLIDFFRYGGFIG